MVTVVGPLPPPLAGVPIHNERLICALEQHGWTVMALTNGRLSANYRPATHLGNSHLRHFAEVLRREPDLLHVHDTRSSLTLAAVLAARLRHVPVVLTFHSAPLTLTGRRRVTRLRSWSLRFADAVIAVHEHVAADLRPHSGSTPVSVVSPYLVPPEGVRARTSAETEQWLRMHAEEPLASFSVYRVLGRFPRRRDVYGVETIALVADRLAERDEMICLIMMLSQPPADRVELRYLESRTVRMRAALGDRFHLAVGEPALPIIAQSSVFLRPTISDGDSIAVREALALGVPVVASDAAPRPPGTILYAVEDVDDLVAKLLGAPGSAVPPPRRGDDDAVAHVLDLYDAVLRSQARRGTLAR